MTRVTRARVIALVIGGVGLAVGMTIFVVATPPAEDPLYDFQNTKSYEQSVERFGGKAALFGNDVQNAIATATHGPNLGLTIAVVSVILAGLYYWRATRGLDESVTQT